MMDIKLLILVFINVCILTANANENEIDEHEQQQNFNNETIRTLKKRLETIDGVEIASSYKEYLDLALGDLDDRLKKGFVKQKDLKERIEKRNRLVSEIENEIIKRRAYSKLLSQKDKLLRTRLIRNTEMKSALQNLADIAGYKLNSLRNSQLLNDVSSDSNGDSDTIASIDLLNKSSFESTSNHNNDQLNADKDSFNRDKLNLLKDAIKRSMTESDEANSTLLMADSSSIDNGLKQTNASNKNNTYTRYIEMAYTEVENLLNNDKQALVEIIRKLKSNEFKLRELEKLKLKVNDSLKRLTEFESKLSVILRNDLEISDYIKNLERKIKTNQINENNGNNNNQN